MNPCLIRFLMAAALIAPAFTASHVVAATFTEFGAVGNGVQDDTEKVRLAVVHAAPGSVIDGEGKVYKVHGSIRISRDLTLKSATFVQDSLPDGVEGPPGDRTLFFRGEAGQPIRVMLRDIKVHRGVNRTQGSPTDAAGIWIDHAIDSELVNVEVTGNGRGTGLFLSDVKNVEVRNLWIHDMTWAPCARQAEGLPWEAIRKAWNSYMVVPMKDCAKAGAERVRIQEPLSGFIVTRSQQVRIIAPVVERLYAAFSDGRELEWQTDGIHIGSDFVNASGVAVPSDILIQSAHISHVWEGLDMSGGPLTNVQVIDAMVSDIHAMGIKMANGTSNVVVRNANVTNSGLAGFAISGKNDPKGTYSASHSNLIVNSAAINTGSNGYWVDQATIAGYRVMEGKVQDPSSIRIEKSQALDDQTRHTMSFGFLSACRNALSVQEVESHGHLKEAIRAMPVDCK